MVQFIFRKTDYCIYGGLYKRFFPTIQYLVSCLPKVSAAIAYVQFKGKTSLAERCDVVGVKREKVYEFFHVCLNFMQKELGLYGS